MSIETDIARAGSTVLYICDRMDEAQTVLANESAGDHADMSSVHRSNGREQIRYTNGGRLVFTSTRTQGHRGYSAAVVSVSAQTYANPDYMASVYPCMDTDTSARVVIR